MEVSPADVEPIVLRSVFTTWTVHLQRVSDDRRHVRSLRLHEGGGVICSTFDADLDWPDRLRTVEEPLRVAAADAMHALVRIGPPVGRLEALWRHPPPVTPYVDEVGQMPNRLFPLAHLQASHVPDAYVQQILTTTQLERARGLPLERWEVAHLGHDRHLVTARDITPWVDADPRPYAGDDNAYTRRSVPDPATLAQARADFASALLTADALARHPSPWGMATW